MMVHFEKYFMCIAWLIILYASGILIFTRGFLLTRFVINNNHTCDLEDTLSMSFTSRSQSSKPENGCWMQARYQRAIVLIIDALRFDFVYFNNSIPQHDLLPYQNKLKTIDRLLHKYPQGSALYHFIADPPTTTLQRLKGLTTGSLPTFVDVASNFDSSSISEDNIIDQLVHQNKTVVFMGDDTWISLFPDHFKRSYAFPSFNVKDLHTVDNGILQHLEPELQKDDWDVLIAHFLGVDHCGHRYGPNHPAMSEKLQQMDETIKSVIDTMDENTVLFVLGDHGMTKTGDHGGDSWNELHAALFVHSPNNKMTTKEEYKNTFNEISQIDLVPTISLLLGSPIPYSNLGTVITDLNYYPRNDTAAAGTLNSQYHVVEALRLNAQQVRKYIHSYANISEFPVDMLADFEKLFAKAEQKFQIAVTELQAGHSGDALFNKFQECKKMYTLCLTRVKKMCQDIWAKFDLTGMLLGIILVSGALGLSVYWFILFNWQPDELNMNLLYGFLSSAWLALVVGILSFAQLDLLPTAIGLFFSILMMVMVVTLLVSVKKLKRDVKLIFSNVEHFPLILVFFYFLSLFSNSFVVHEDSLCAYFLVSLIAHKSYHIIKQLYVLSSKDKLHLIRKQSKNEQKKFDIVRLLTSPICIVIILVISTCILVRASVIFRACREEQWNCEPTSFLKSLSTLSDDERQYKNVRYFGIVGVVVCLPLFVRSWMRSYGNLNGQDVTVLCIRYIQPVGFVFLSLYWALQALPRKTFDNLPEWEVTIFPRLVYSCAGVICLCVLARPLCLYLVYRSNDETSPNIFGAENVVPRMYNHIKENWRRHMHSSSSMPSASAAEPAKSSPPPMVYGLATVYSASLLVLMSAAALLLLLLLGDGLAPSLITALAIMFLLLELHATHQTVKRDKGFTTSWASILMYGFLGSEHFFSTGHQAVVTTIQWQAAYHGFEGDFEYYCFPAALITANTFASYILCVLGLPLLMFWPRFRGDIIQFFESSKSKEQISDTKGEFILHENNETFRGGLAQLFIGYMMFHGIKVLGTMGCALIHRRHLMVWKIFAPRFVFEGATFFVIGILCTLVYLFIIRVDSALGKWLKKLES